MTSSAWRCWRIALVLFLVSGGLATVANTGPALAASGPSLSVDTQADRHAISPDIYGMNFYGTSFNDYTALMGELKLPVDRWGGNLASRYNWQTNSTNSGDDYYFESYINSDNNPALGQPSASDDFINRDRAHGVKSIITLPMIGYVEKDRTRHLCGFSLAKYGPQQKVAPDNRDCGNGILTNGKPITNNNPLDTSLAIGPAFDQNWVTHLVGQYGSATNGGVHFYDLDNEPSLWNAKHQDVHPIKLTYDELRDRTYQYGAAAKAGDSTALTLGPSNWGYPVYTDSGVPGDKLAHGGVGFSEWYLQQMRLYEQQHGQRILDYFDQHYYPAQKGVTLAPAGDAATQALRLRSTRSLWDPTYVDESWIGDTKHPPIRLIPQFRDWVATNYPGTKTAITEYNFGGLESINGALAQADVLGIFGREQLDLATLWEPPSSTQPGAYAFRMYRNYDGHGSMFGDTWVRSTSSDQGQLSIYGAERSQDGALTLMIINKTGTALTSDVALSNFRSANLAQVYRYSADNLNAIVRQPDLAVGATDFQTTYPANSITLVVLPPGGATLTVTAATDDGTGHDPGNGTLTLSQALSQAQPYDTISFQVPGGKLTMTGPLLATFPPHLSLKGGACGTPPTTLDFNRQEGLTLPGGTILQDLKLVRMAGPGLRNSGPDNFLRCTVIQK